MFDYDIPIEATIDVPLPEMTTVRQIFSAEKLDDVSASVRGEISRENIASRIVKGEKIAIGVGSRGIANIADIVITLVSEIKSLGAEPFIFPAMGTHGSVTAAGQIQVLADFGITEASAGVPIKSSSDSVLLGSITDGTEVYVDRYAYAADGIILVNRIKPHTTFRGSVGSGITKMMVVGMGNASGAAAAHNHRVDQFIDTLKEMASLIMERTPFLFGLGLIENAYDETAHIEVIPSEKLLQRESELYVLAKEKMGRLDFDDIDVLIVDRMGKDISGAGVDPNITGRNNRGVEGNLPNIEKIVVLDLTDESHGNAGGIGLMDVIPRSLFDKIDFAATYGNVITSGFLDGAHIPIIMSTARKAVMLAIATVPVKKPDEVRVVRIQDTLTLGEIKVSASMLEEVSANKNFELVGKPAAWEFFDLS